MKAILVKNSETIYFPDEIQALIDEIGDKKEARTFIYPYILKDARSYAITTEMFSAKEIESCKGHFVKVLGRTDWFYTWNPNTNTVVGYRAVEIPDNENWDIIKGNEINEVLHTGRQV